MHVPSCALCFSQISICQVTQWTPIVRMKRSRNASLKTSVSLSLSPGVLGRIAITHVSQTEVLHQRKRRLRLGRSGGILETKGAMPRARSQLMNLISEAKACKGTQTEGFEGFGATV